MKALIYALAGLATVMAFAVAAPPAGAQTAADVNRLNAAIQVCNSGFAATPECAKLRGQLGARGGGGPGLGGGGTAGALAGMLGGAMAPKPVAVAPPPSVGIDLNKAITACVARAAGVEAEIQRCLAIAGGGAPKAR